MIVLSEEHKDFLVEFLSAYEAEMLSKGLRIRPIPIKNNLWILPETVLNDPRCARAKADLIAGGHLQKMTIREVVPEEFISSA